MKKRITAVALTLVMTLALAAPAMAAEYTVVKGDSLWKIAKTQLGSGYRWSEIYQANKGTIKDPNKIYVGQKLEIPDGTAPVEPTPAPVEPTPAPAPAGETKTGTGKGFGGDIVATLTVADGKITACTLTGDKETAFIGGAALPTLADQVVAAGGSDIDGVSGATVTTNGVKEAVDAALGTAPAEPEVKPDTMPVPAAKVAIDGKLQLGVAYGAAHGTKCFSQAHVVVMGDTIVAAFLDDFQFMAGEGVPNSTEGFGAGYADPAKPLVSKRVNNELYSANMAGHGGSTVQIATNWDTIQDFVVGKTIAEVEALSADKAAAVDAVTGATLADTAGYLGLIAQAAKNAKEEAAVAFKGSSDDLSINVIYAAAHGTKCFTAAAAVTAGEKIVLSYLDDFQFVASDAGLDVVPNSAEGFGAGYAEGKALASKRCVADYYSANMAKSGSTVRIDDNFDAIQAHVNGKTVAEIEALANSENPVDAVSGATLVDTAGYLKAIVEAAKGANGLQLGLAYGAAHGTKCFSQAHVVVKGDVIVAAHIDEYQFMAGGEAVPSSDAAFGNGYADATKPLVSKRVNNELYSSNMAARGGSTVKLDDNWSAIEKFVVGKTIAEVEGYSRKDDAVDAVSGATLADTAGYLGLIAKAAQNARSASAVTYTGDTSKLTLKTAFGAANGDRGFTVCAALSDGETIVLSYIDEFQFQGGEDYTGVPNSDVAEGFAAGYADPATPIISKRVNSVPYSAIMTAYAQSTVSIADNWDAIQDQVNGMTIAEAEALAGKGAEAVDAVSGATLANTAAYVAIIVEAAK